MTQEDKKVVSPFEFAIMTLADSEKAKTMRPETEKERIARIREDVREFFSKIKCKS